MGVDEINFKTLTPADYDELWELWNQVEQTKRALNPVDDSREGITKVFGLVFKDNDKANSFWEKMGYSLRTNLNYRNKSLDADVPTGE